MKCLSAIPLELMLLEIWIQICILSDLIKDIINTSIVYLYSVICILTD